MSRDLTDPEVRAELLAALVRTVEAEPLELTPGEVSAYAAVASHRRRRRALERAAQRVAEP